MGIMGMKDQKETSSRPDNVFVVVFFGTLPQFSNITSPQKLPARYVGKVAHSE
jgi:hypothetical protein